MADRTSIEWTDATWTPIRARNRATGKVGWHCEHVSEGCRNCYAETFNRDRLGTGLAFKPGHQDDVDIFLDETMLLAPLRWKKPRRIFVCSMTDLFGVWVPDAMIDRIFAVMALAPRHSFQVPTKRPARMRAYLCDPATHDRITQAAVEIWLKAGNAARRWPDEPDYVLTRRVDGIDRAAGPWPLPNVWLGVSAEDQPTANERIPELVATPAAIHFVSAEPLLSEIDFSKIDVPIGGRLNALNGHWSSWPMSESGGRTLLHRRSKLPCLDWIIVGGESGPDARPMHPAWARSIRDQSAAAGVPFLFKQWGEYRPLGGMMERIGKRRAGRLLDGVEHNGMPEVRHG